MNVGAAALVLGLAACARGGATPPSTSQPRTTTTVAPLIGFCAQAAPLLSNITTALDAETPLRAAAASLDGVDRAELDDAIVADRASPPAPTVSEGLDPAVSNRSVVELVNRLCRTSLPVTSKPA